MLTIPNISIFLLNYPARLSTILHNLIYILT